MNLSLEDKRVEGEISQEGNSNRHGATLEGNVEAGDIGKASLED